MTYYNAWEDAAKLSKLRRAVSQDAFTVEHGGNSIRIEIVIGIGQSPYACFAGTGFSVHGFKPPASLVDQARRWKPFI
jgi:hypothetical protein